MDVDYLRDFDVQYPNVPSSATSNVGLYARFLAIMPDWTDVSRRLNKAFSALPIPMKGPPPPACSIHEAIQVSISYMISYPDIRHSDIIPDIIPDIRPDIIYDMIFGTGLIGSTLG